MPDFSLPIYNKPRTWIKDGREQGNYPWEEILTDTPQVLIPERSLRSPYHPCR